MEKFSAYEFYQTARILELLIANLQMKDSLSHRAVMTAEDREENREDTLKLAQGCAKIGLRMSAMCATDIAGSLGDEHLTNARCAEKYAELQSRIQDEMSLCLFLHVPSDRAEYYGTSALFGDLVGENFSSANFDIKEAGNCYAAGRDTACVFHLMRVLEIGLRALGKVFGVSLEHVNWAPALDQIESKIREMHKEPAWKALPDCKEQQEFYAQAASHFGVLKDAWRNYTVHVRGKYTPEEAELILRSTRGFMQKLAGRLKE
jgi:hypothetical protein